MTRETNKEHSRKKDIAIVGMSVCLHGTPDLNSFWNKLLGGKEFFEVELMAENSHQDKVSPGSFKVHSEVDASCFFDHAFFGYTSEEARLMDPQIRLMHQQAVHAIDDASCDLSKYTKDVGVYFSANDNINWRAYSLLQRSDKVSEFYKRQISDKNFISSLISYSLNLTGPSIYVDSACSSSLVAVHLAARGLLLGECSMALAGGVNISSLEEQIHIHEGGLIFSKDAHCRAFDTEASGTLAGHGSGVVVLKRYEDAIKDGDRIYAIIRSTYVNNDGKQKVGYTAPSVIGQSHCIKRALKLAGLQPGDINYVEAHGTGTKLGDPIEVQALNKAFEYNTGHSCLLGSVKTNLGHLDTASGIVGLIKTALILHHKIVPATLHFKKANSEIDFASGPFGVNDKNQSWKNDGNPGYAGVSSFGIGGTNAHVILEEVLSDSDLSKRRQDHLLVFSAKTKGSIQLFVNELLNSAQKNKDLPIDYLSYTLAKGRQAYPLRSYLVAKDHDHLVSGLESFKETSKVNKTFKGKCAFLFPGQGSQYFKMAEAIYQAETYFRNIVDEGLSLIYGGTGSDYKSIIGYGDEIKEFDREAINNTRYTQPLLFVIQYALARLVMKWGVKPDILIGHSLGEYVAACIAEVFSFEEGIRLIVKRAELMSALPNGSMLAVAANADDIRVVLPSKISVAAINTTDSCVVSGNVSEIEKLLIDLNEKHVVAKKLKTSHAFHSEMMDPILNAFLETLKEINFSTPTFSVISNVTGEIHNNKTITSPDYWVKQLREAVLFSKGLDTILSDRDTLFIEIGATGAISAPVKTAAAKYPRQTKVIGLLPHPADAENDHRYLLNAVGELWSLGIQLRWEDYFVPENRKVITAPGYQFEKIKFPVHATLPSNEVFSDYMEKSDQRNVEKWLYQMNWKQSNLIEADVTSQEQFLIFSDNLELTSHLAKDNNVIIARSGNQYGKESNNSYEIDLARRSDFDQLLKDVQNSNLRIDQIVIDWQNVPEDSYELKPYNVLLNLFQSLNKVLDYTPKKITVIADFGLIRTNHMHVYLCSAMTLGHIYAQENSGVFFNIIDTAKEDRSKAIHKLGQELKLNFIENTVAYHNGRRWQPGYNLVKSSTKATKNYIPENGLYVITGGAGKVGWILVKHLLRKYNGKVVILGRKTKEEIVEARIADLTLLSGFAGDHKDYNALAANLFYYQTDISDRHRLTKCIEKIEFELGKIIGVIHAAGNVDRSGFLPIEDVNQSSLNVQFSAKIQGTLNLYDVLYSKEELKFVWLTSSLSAVVGGITYGAYAAANAFMDLFVIKNQERLYNWFAVNLDGISENLVNEDSLCEIFDRSFSIQSHSQLIVSVHGLDLDGKQPKKETGLTSISARAADRPCLETEFSAPSTETEKQLVQIWCSFFNMNEIGVLDDFFELGGDSLKAMTISKMIFKKFDIDLKMTDLYHARSIKKLAKEIDLTTELKVLGNVQSISTKDGNRNEIRI